MFCDPYYKSYVDGSTYYIDNTYGEYPCYTEESWSYVIWDFVELSMLTITSTLMIFSWTQWSDFCARHRSGRTIPTSLRSPYLLLSAGALLAIWIFSDALEAVRGRLLDNLGYVLPFLLCIIVAVATWWSPYLLVCMGTLLASGLSSCVLSFIWIVFDNIEAHVAIALFWIVTSLGIWGALATARIALKPSNARPVLFGEVEAVKW